MRPLKLTLTGFKGIQAGMGLDTFTLDLTQFDDAQLIAIVAPNGRGKTTVLDNLQPFRLMGSKIKGANYSPDAFSFFDHLVSPGKAKKDLVWEHKGVKYRTLLEWNITARTQGTSAYLQQWEDNRGEYGWVPVTLADGTSSDGKAKTYDKCVEAILGSPRLYFTAAFSAQGRSQLSSYAQGDIKGLMAEVLDLNKIQALGVKATELTKAFRSRIHDQRNRLQELELVRFQADELATTIDQHTAALKMRHIPAIESGRRTVEQETLALADIRREQQDAEQLRVRRQAVQDQIQKAESERMKASQFIYADLKAAEDQHQTTSDRLDSAEIAADSSITKATQRKESAERLLLQRDAINSAIGSLPGLRDAITAAEAKQIEEDARVSDLLVRRAELQQLESSIANLVDTGRRIRIQVEDLTKRCALTQEVPCKGTDLQGHCKLLAEANEAEAKLPKANEDLAARLAEHQAASARRQALAEEVQTLSALRAAAQAAADAVRKARQQLSDAEKLAALAGSLESAEATTQEAHEAINANRIVLDDILKQRNANDQQYEARRHELEARKAQTEQASREKLQQLQTELDRIPVPDDETVLNAAVTRLKAAEKALQDAQEAADSARGAIATAQGRLSVLKESLESSKALSAEVAHLEAETSLWELLQKALGRDGILALSIDDAGPTLAGLANDLLLSCYGPRFSVRIDTQETVKTTGAQKESFDVSVFDSESDSSKSVSEMSGGERIWINEALTRAIALYQAQQSGQSFDTLFSDESDGALDPEKKGQFVQMKRRVLELGGYKNEFFISHSPDVWPLADAVLQLGEAHV